MIVQALGGLCNRLRVILSHRDVYGPITVVWEPCGEIAGARWDEVFAPLSGVQFVYARPAHVDVATTDAIRGVHWYRHMGEVTPLSSIRARIDELRDQMGRYDAMFMRRTDGIHVAAIEGNFTTDEVFRQFADSTSGPLFLATDNGETQAKVRGWVGDRLVVEGPLPGHEIHEGGDHHRNQALAGSVVNLYMCMYADRFQGSGGSSFSFTIEAMRSMFAHNMMGGQ